MRNNKVFLIAAAIALTSFSAPSMAETVIHTETVVTPREVEDGNMIDFSAFDTNNDGVLTMAEVGERLFYLFDRDGNEIIDNNEFYNESVITIAPMKKETLTLVDQYGDGIVDQTSYTYENFLEASQLTKFTDDYSGLSPREFIDSSFLVLDDNNDHVVDLQEWKQSYLIMTKPPNAEQDRYND